ncbi:hypothetical protein [Paraburkholderia atlantica]|uniref:hypothetical protein n=1 Tax=Paraburkholderia atlantica TaxID=2654982 RepID=UPI000377D22D|nr:hypothetical protein [Paraburkholderia atlantica]
MTHSGELQFIEQEDGLAFIHAYGGEAHEITVTYECLEGKLGADASFDSRGQKLQQHLWPLIKIAESKIDEGQLPIISSRDVRIED